MADTDHQRHGLLAVAARTVLLFQALLTGLCIVLMGLNLFLNIDDAYIIPKDPPSPGEAPLPPTYGPDAYPVVRQLFLVVFTAIIICIIVVELNHSDPHPKTAARLELVKGLLATATWLWLLLDVIFYVSEYPCQYFDPYWRYRRRKIIFMAWSIIILCVFFYPLMFWRAREARLAKGKVGVIEERATRDESTPLLQHQ